MSLCLVFWTSNQSLSDARAVACLDTRRVLSLLGGTDANLELPSHRQQESSSIGSFGLNGWKSCNQSRGYTQGQTSRPTVYLTGSRPV